MKLTHLSQLKRLVIFPILAIGLTFIWLQPLVAQEGRWKAGVGVRVITPQKTMWMAGYAARDRPAEGTMHDLWVKALAIQDSEGKRAVFISTDLLGVSKSISENVTSKLKADFQLERSQIMLTTSHTHSGPVLHQTLVDIYPLDENQKEEIEVYTAWLQKRIIEAVAEALNNLKPGNVYTGMGQTRFAVNRRNNSEQDIALSAELKGPVDHSVPVLKVEDLAGKVQAIVFGYACHATTLDGYHWSGDYPGFAQMEIENRYQGATAFFFAGCGGDQNPLPRRTIPLAEQYGRELAGAVSGVLQESMIKLDPFLSTTFGKLDLAFSEIPDKEQLLEVEKSEVEYYQHWARAWIQRIESGEEIPESYPDYPIQTWKLGDQIWVALGGEVVVDYSIYLKRLLGQDLFITAYANDVMAYIPSLRVLREGGYEGNTSMRAYGLPAPWAPEIEIKILHEVHRQVVMMHSHKSLDK